MSNEKKVAGSISLTYEGRLRHVGHDDVGFVIPAAKRGELGDIAMAKLKRWRVTITDGVESGGE